MNGLDFQKMGPTVVFHSFKSEFLQVSLGGSRLNMGRWGISLIPDSHVLAIGASMHHKSRPIQINMGPLCHFSSIISCPCGLVCQSLINLANTYKFLVRLNGAQYQYLTLQQGRTHKPGGPALNNGGRRGNAFFLVLKLGRTQSHGLIHAGFYSGTLLKDLVSKLFMFVLFVCLYVYS